MNKLGAGGRPGRGSFLTADPVAQDAALNEASHASEQRALTALKEYQSYEYSGNGSNGNGSSANGSNGNGANSNGSNGNGSSANGHGSNGHH
jgi:ubiquinol-cytochrome c reductase cytochrome b subunit